MAILESIAAANAAYSVIKTALGNGKETAGLISAVGKFLSAEEDVKEAVQKKKNSPITAITGSSEGDWEEFQHLEMLRQKRAELESYCRLYAPPGTWDRWQQWQVEARKQRKAAKLAAEKAREERMEFVATLAGIVIAFSVLAVAFYYLGVYLEKW
jgi:cytochrome c-type biogenesis protein CcmH/NrfG